MLAIAQRSINKITIMNPHSFFDESEMTYPHQPECLLTLSRRAGKLPRSSAQAVSKPSQRTGSLLNGRDYTTEFFVAHTSLVPLWSRPPALNKFPKFPRTLK